MPPQPQMMLPTTPLFSGVKFYLTGIPQPHTVPLLVGGEGRKLSYLSSLSTHCIATQQPDYQEMAEAEELLDVPVVSEEWVTSSARCGHVLPVRGFSTSASQLFSGVTLVMDWDTLDKEDCEKIWAMVSWYGGRVGKEVQAGTHLVTGRASDRQVERGGKLMVVTPAWVVDSVRDGGRKKEEEYHPSWLVGGKMEEENHLKIKRGHHFGKESISPVQEASVGESNLIQSKETQLDIGEDWDEGVESYLSTVLTLKDNKRKSMVEVNTTNTSPLSLLSLCSTTPNQDAETESSQDSLHHSAASNTHHEFDNTHSDYFSQDMESPEEEVTGGKGTEIEDEMDSSGGDMFGRSLLKKMKILEERQSSDVATTLSILSPGSSRWSKTDKFRTAYSTEEAQALINFFMEQGCYFMRGGTQIWKIVEKARICPGRSWQSLKQFFLKYLVKQLPSYGVTEEELKSKARSKEEGGLCGGRRSSESEIVTSFYTKSEDKMILNYIMDHGRVEGMSVGGTRIWKMMEKKTVVVGRQVLAKHLAKI